MSNKNRTNYKDTDKGNRGNGNRNKGGNRYKKNNGQKPNPKDTDIPEVAQEGGHTNPPDDGFDSTELLNQTMTLGFQTILGDTFMDAGYREPTIAICKMAQSPGSSFYVNEAGNYTSERDGLNLAISDFYTSLSAFSGRTSTYAPQDVGMLLLAMGSVIEHIEHWRRVIGVARVYNERNETMPLRLVEALGVANGVNFCRSITSYIDYLNTIITSFNTLPIPGNIKYLKRCRKFYQKVYWDTPLLTAQVIATVPTDYWLIDETTYAGGTILKATPTPTVSSVTDLSYLMSMVDALLNSSTYQIIRSDILNVASKLKVEMWKMDGIDGSYRVLPECDPSFMLKWHNMTIMGYPAYNSLDSTSLPGTTITPSNDVYPDPSTNMLLYNPAFGRGSAIEQQADIILDMPVENPTPVDIFEATRFVAASGWTYNDGTQNWAVNAVLPDHFCTNMYVYSGTISNTVRASVSRTTYADAATYYSTYTKNASVLSQFRAHPRYVLIDSTTTPVTPMEFWDVDFFTHVPVTKLRRMYRLIYQGLFKFRMNSQDSADNK